MPISTGETLIIVVIMTVVTFATRAVPFFIFRKGQKTPQLLEYLGVMLPPAAIALLVVFCYKNVTFLEFPYGIPEVISGLVVLILHAWKRNMILSIAAGTILYMIFVQVVFPLYY